MDPAKCDSKHVYMLYLWIDTLYQQTFQRIPEGGNLEYGVAPTLGATSFNQWMNVMRFEFPVIVYAHALQSTTAKDAKCPDVYTGFGFNADQSAAVCSNATFNDIDGISGFFNLLTVYFFGNTNNP